MENQASNTHRKPLPGDLTSPRWAKTLFRQPKSLIDICVETIGKNLDMLDDIGEVPIDVLRPALRRADAKRLKILQRNSKNFAKQSNEFWLHLCHSDFYHRRAEFEGRKFGHQQVYERMCREREEEQQEHERKARLLGERVRARYDKIQEEKDRKKTKLLKFAAIPAKTRVRQPKSTIQKLWNSTPKRTFVTPIMSSHRTTTSSNLFNGSPMKRHVASSAQFSPYGGTVAGASSSFTAATRSHTVRPQVSSTMGTTRSTTTRTSVAPSRPTVLPRPAVTISRQEISPRPGVFKAVPPRSLGTSSRQEALRSMTTTSRQTVAPRSVEIGSRKIAATRPVASSSLSNETSQSLVSSRPTSAPRTPPTSAGRIRSAPSSSASAQPPAKRIRK
ncbi:hypothetical protein G9A89_010079 [Geosiphon pyriformis]|nr:hypothetical protein G9A89_010079 [Geosiphon pyriformis]